MKVADEVEAVRMANDSEFGLSATVWSGNKTRAARVARQLEVGAVNINDAFSNMFNFTLPMGGRKASGLGARFGGAAAIHKYCILHSAGRHDVSVSQTAARAAVVPVLADQGALHPGCFERCHCQRSTKARILPTESR